MATTWKSLADGQLPSSTGVLYTVPASTRTSITYFAITNTDTSPRTFNIYITRVSSSARRIAGKDWSIADGDFVNICDAPEGIRLSPGDTISGDASVGSKLDYVICGVESV